MHVTYAPKSTADGDRQEWDVDLTDLRQSEAERIEREAGMTVDEFDQAVLAGNSRARKVLLWHLMREQHPKLSMRDVPDFRRSELELELSRVELERLREGLADAPIPEDQRAQMMAALDLQLSKLAEAAPVGKARSETSAAATG